MFISCVGRLYDNLTCAGMWGKTDTMQSVWGNSGLFGDVSMLKIYPKIRNYHSIHD